MTGYGKILLILSVIDLLVTALGIHLRILEEANVFLRWHLEKGGILLFASVKILVTSVFILVLETIYEKYPAKRAAIKKAYLVPIICLGLAAVYGVGLLIFHKRIISIKAPGYSLTDSSKSSGVPR